jgi:hypothetical protein
MTADRVSPVQVCLDKVIRLLRRPTIKNRSMLPPIARWSIALAAMYSRVRDGCGADMAGSVAILRERFGVTGETSAERRDQALEVLAWLVEKGHRANPDLVDCGTAKDLLAWDIARAVMVTRHAVIAQCFSEADGWAVIREVAAKTQASFGSWEDYARCCHRGRLRWARRPGKVFDDAVDFLLNTPKLSPRQLGWRTSPKHDDFGNPMNASQ